MQSSLKEDTRKVDRISQNIIPFNTTRENVFPGKKSSTFTKAKIRSKYKNKCKKCEVKYKNNKGNKLQRFFGDQNSWIGCDKGCE